VLARGIGGPGPEAVAPLGTGMAPDLCNGLPLVDLRLSGFDETSESTEGSSLGVASVQLAASLLLLPPNGLRGFSDDG